METKLMLWFLFSCLSQQVFSFSLQRLETDILSRETEIQSENFVKTLQSMVEPDLVRKPAKYRRLEDDPYVWKFFIRPKDLEELLNNTNSDVFNQDRLSRILAVRQSRDKSRRYSSNLDIKQIIFSRSKRQAPDQSIPAVLYLPLG